MITVIGNYYLTNDLCYYFFVMKIVKIDEVNDERLDIFYRKNEKQLMHINEPEPGVFIAESELVINRALDENYEPISFLIKENEKNKYDDIFKRCNDNIIIYQVDEEIFNQLKGFILIKGILACFKRKADLLFEDVIKDAQRIVVLEEVENPTNVGAIIRNACAFYADGIIFTNDSSDPLYRRSIRVSMGNVFKTKWCKVDRDTYIDELHKYGFKTVAMALRDDSVDIDDEKLNSEDKLAIILGSEGYGLSDNTIKNSDYIVKIKMNPKIDSLNVASASGIALWQICKRK